MALRIQDLNAHVGSFELNIRGKHEIRAGELLAILGPSGAGKSTLLNVIAGFVPLRAGSIMLEAMPLHRLVPERRRTAYVFQRSFLFPHLSVRGNIEFALRIARWSKAARDAEVESLAHALEIDGLLDRAISEISEGQAQRVALARALAPQFEILLLDEPFSALDERNRMIARGLIIDRAKLFGTHVLMVTHQWEDAEFATARAWWLEAGSLREEIEVDKLKLRKPELS